MPLSVGDPAPDFTLPSTEGKDFQLSRTMKAQPLIIYFYPKDFTPGCTAEACGFRDSCEIFRQADLPIVGISQDDVQTHQKFKKAHNLNFPLLSDLKGEVASRYKARMPIINFTRRITYLLDDRHRIGAVYENLMGANRHIEEMQKQLQKNVHLS